MGRSVAGCYGIGFDDIAEVFAAGKLDSSANPGFSTLCGYLWLSIVAHRYIVNIIMSTALQVDLCSSIEATLGLLMPRVSPGVSQHPRLYF